MKLIFLILIIFLVGCTNQVYTLEQMQVCETDSDCIYVDNSVCPHTNIKNIIPINEKYKDEYLKNGHSREGIICTHIYVEREIPPKCVENKCVIGE